MRPSCPVCGNSVLDPLLRIDGVPVNCSVLFSDIEAARNAARGTLDLVLCKTCTHIFNRAYRADIIEYAIGYDNSLSFSPTFRDYAEELAHHLIKAFELNNKLIVEIGSGDGQFLAALCNAGCNYGYGFDPSVPARTDGKKLTFISELYSSRFTNIFADFICCRHVLEHLDEPRQMLASVMTALSGCVRGQGLYFEVPNSAFLLEGGSIWDFIYAHVSYYSARSLRALFEGTGFGVRSVQPRFGSQFLSIEAGGPEMNLSEDDCLRTTQVSAAPRLSTAVLYQNTLQYWNNALEEERHKQSNVAVWGAGTKCVSFLAAISSPEIVSVVVDLNPRKQGYYLPCSGVRVVKPEALSCQRPDLIIVVNPIYELEIRERLQRQGMYNTRVQSLIPAFQRVCA